MTHGQLYQLLKKTKIPVRYDHFDYEVKPPYLCFWSTGRSYILADDKTYIKLHDYEIGLYVKEKNPELEEKIEKLLRETLKQDRAKTQVEGFTKLNLMELTRKHICAHNS